MTRSPSPRCATSLQLSLHQPLRRCLRATALALACSSVGLAQADIVTLPGGQPLAGCPFPGLSYLCVVEGQAQVTGPTAAPFEKVRISRTAGTFNGGALTIGSGASLTLSPNQSSADMVVGDNVGAAGSLLVTDGGRLTINAPDPNLGGLVVGAFAAPPDAPLGLGGVPLPSTTMLVQSGGIVIVNKPAGPLIGSAVAFGREPGSNSSLVLDGGIGNFGIPALGATLSTAGNISIGREGKGAVSLPRNATMTAGITYMSVISTAGSSGLTVGVGSTVNGSVIAGVARDAATGLADPLGNTFGSASLFVQQGGSINGTLTMGRGARLYGSGSVAGVVNYGGVVAPGNSPGTLSIGSGGFSDVQGRLVIEFASNASSGRDRLVVAGPVSLNGTTIEFSFTDGFAPSMGNSFEFLTTSGAVPSMIGLQYIVSGLQPGFQFSVLPGANGQLLFNALNNGVSAVPEPGGFALMALALVAGALGRRRLRSGLGFGFGLTYLVPNSLSPASPSPGTM